MEQLFVDFNPTYFGGRGFKSVGQDGPAQRVRAFLRSFGLHPLNQFQAYQQRPYPKNDWLENIRLQQQKYLQQFLRTQETN